MATQTYWGKSQTAKKITDGIIFYTTASHGGFHVSKKLNQQIHWGWRREDGWYEEDCEWSIVVLTFPTLFHADEVHQAHLIAQREYHSFYCHLFRRTEAKNSVRVEC